MTLGRLQSSEAHECIGCGFTPSELDSVISYHTNTEQSPDLLSGFVCADCRQHIEAILTGSQTRECENCGAPFPEAGRLDVREYDYDGNLQDIASICRRCLGRRYSSKS